MSTPSSRLLGLLLELRDLIYELATDDPIHFDFRGTGTKRSFRVKKGLLLTNRQLHEEYLSMLWRYFLGSSSWTFHVDDSELQGFMGVYEACSEEERRQLRRGNFAVVVVVVERWAEHFEEYTRCLRRWFSFCERTGFDVARYELVPDGELVVQRFVSPGEAVRIRVKGMLKAMSERMRRNSREYAKLQAAVSEPSHAR